MIPDWGSSRRTAFQSGTKNAIVSAGNALALVGFLVLIRQQTLVPMTLATFAKPLFQYRTATRSFAFDRYAKQFGVIRYKSHPQHLHSTALSIRRIFPGWEGSNQPEDFLHPVPAV